MPDQNKSNKEAHDRAIKYHQHRKQYKERSTPARAIFLRLLHCFELLRVMNKTEIHMQQLRAPGTTIFHHNEFFVSNPGDKIFIISNQKNPMNKAPIIAAS
jgi:hypothetical protein